MGSHWLVNSKQLSTKLATSADVEIFPCEVKNIKHDTYCPEGLEKLNLHKKYQHTRELATISLMCGRLMSTAELATISLVCGRLNVHPLTQDHFTRRALPHLQGNEDGLLPDLGKMPRTCPIEV
jgi:hypothetical protein